MLKEIKDADIHILVSKGLAFFDLKDDRLHQMWFRSLKSAYDTYRFQVAKQDEMPASRLIRRQSDRMMNGATKLYDEISKLHPVLFRLIDEDLKGDGGLGFVFNLNDFKMNCLDLIVTLGSTVRNFQPSSGARPHLALENAVQTIAPLLERMAGERLHVKGNADKDDNPEPGNAACAYCVEILQAFDERLLTGTILNKIREYNSDMNCEA